MDSSPSPLGPIGHEQAVDDPCFGSIHHGHGAAVPTGDPERGVVGLPPQKTHGIHPIPCKNNVTDKSFDIFFEMDCSPMPIIQKPIPVCICAHKSLIIFEGTTDNARFGRIGISPVAHHRQCSPVRCAVSAKNGILQIGLDVLAYLQGPSETIVAR